MGASVSRSKNILTNDIVMNAISKTVNRCTSRVKQEQSIRAGEADGDVNISNVSFKMTAKVDLECFFKNETQQQLQADIMNQIKEQMKNKGGDLFTSGVLTASDIETTVNNAFKANVEVETLQETLSQQDQLQTIDIGKGKSINIDGVNFDMSAEGITKMTFENAGYQSALNQITNDLDQKIDNEAGGLFNMLGDNMTVIMIGVVIVAIVGGIGYLFMQNPQAANTMLRGAPRRPMPMTNYRNPMYRPPPTMPMPSKYY